MSAGGESGRLWGGRFAEGPAQAAAALGDEPLDRRLWREDLDGSVAHAGELLRVGVLTQAQHSAILRGLETARAELADGSFTFQPGDEDLHGAVERRLVELVGADGGRLRAGRSRNDQIASDLRRFCVTACDALTGEVRSLQEALADQAEATIEWVAPGYTHLQRAQPVTLAHHLLAHAWALDRDAGRLADCATRTDVEALGSGALAGSTLGLDPARYAAALGAGGAAPNSIDAVSDRDFAIELLAAAAMLGVHCSRLGEEIVLWSTEEFRWARVGDAFSTGSSIMPQKRNPDVAELVRGKTGRLIGDLVALLVTLKGLPLSYDRDLQEDKSAVFDAVDTLTLVLPALTGTVESLVFDRDRLEACAADGFSLATDLAEALVRRGVAFRDAHERVGALVAQAERAGIDLAGLGADLVVAALPELADADADLADLLDPVAAVGRRDAVNGPAPDAVRGQLAALRARIAH